MGIADNIKKAEETTAEDVVKKQQQELQEDSLGTVVTPLGGAVSGQSPDQAKMQGTPAQKDTALAQAAEQAARLEELPQEQTLAGALGYQQPTQQISPELERAKEFSKKMSEFGSLGKRVENYVTDQMAEASAVNVQIDFDDESIAGLAANNPEETKAVLEQFNELAKTDQTAAMKVLAENQDKFKDASTVFDLIKGAYPDEASQQTALAESFAKNVIDPDDITIDKVLGVLGTPEDPNQPIEALGGLTVADLNEMVGPEWTGMKVGEIGAALEAQREDILNNVQEIQKQLANPNLSPAIRQQLNEELQKYAATGVIQAEAEAQRAVENANNSGKIMFGGKVQDINELLDDENIQSMVGEFLVADEAEKKKLMEQEGMSDFYNWVDREFQKVVGGADSVEGAISKFEDVQKENSEKIKDSGHDEDLLKIFGIDGEAWTAEAIEIPEEQLKKAAPVHSQLTELEGTLDRYRNNPDKLMGLILGGDFGTQEQTNKTLAKLKHWANFGDIESKAMLSKLAPIMSGGKLDTNKFIAMVEKATNIKRTKDSLTNGSIQKLLTDIDNIGKLKPRSVSPEFSETKLRVVEDLGKKSASDLIDKNSEDIEYLDELLKVAGKDKKAVQKAIDTYVDGSAKRIGDSTGWVEFDRKTTPGGYKGAFKAEMDLENQIARQKDPRIKKKLEGYLKKLRKSTKQMSMGGWGRVVDTSRHFSKNLRKDTPQEIIDYFGGAITEDDVVLDTRTGKYRIKYVKENGYNPRIQDAITQRYVADRRREYRKKYSQQ